MSEYTTAELEELLKRNIEMNQRATLALTYSLQFLPAAIKEHAVAIWRGGEAFEREIGSSR